MSARRPRDARAWMELQLDTLFRRDTDGRLIEVRDPEGRPPPNVFLGRTCEGNVWAVSAGLENALARELDGLLANEPVPETLDGRPPRCEAELCARLVEQGLGTTRWQGPAFYFPSPPDAVRGLIRADSALLARFAPLAEDRLADIEPCVLGTEEGLPVSACHAARRTDAACEAGVETLESARGRGYARAVVQGWAREVFESGREPLYSTSWGNAASRAVARALGLVCYGEDWHLGG